VELPAGDAWHRMSALYEQVAQVVASYPNRVPVVISGYCTTSLGVLAGLQRGGHEVGIVWFDAHADFHTEDTTTSGYLGGLSLALAAGVGTLRLPAALGLDPVAKNRIVLVDARDSDPPEQVLLGRTAIRPDGALYVHLDVDVCDPSGVPDLRHPVPAGCTPTELVAAVERVMATGRVAAMGIAATWHHDGAAVPPHHDLLQRLVQARAVS
jgi:arginase